MSARILITEDEGIVAADIEDRLRSLGYQVTATCSSGAEALKKVEETKPDLVMMDIMIQGDMDGIETGAIIRSKFKLPVIYLTAYSDDATFERAKITEPFGYLIKPFEEKELRVNIEMALYKHRMEKERDRLVTDLKQALNAVKLLSGLLPICAACKKIRDDNGYWSEVENYISLHSDADFTHGYCPECADQVLSCYLADHEKNEAEGRTPAETEAEA
ncbi:MAG: response regulator [Verrucomicrobiia bacterium]|jgi:CheY-like chemotaxis protein